MSSDDQVLNEAFGLNVEMAWRRSSAARTYLTAVWAHSTAAVPSLAAQRDFEAFWRTCPAPRACGAARRCMLVEARRMYVWRARNALRITRGV